MASSYNNRISSGFIILFISILIWPNLNLFIKTLFFSGSNLFPIKNLKFCNSSYSYSPKSFSSSFFIGVYILYSELSKFSSIFIFFGASFLVIIKFPEINFEIILSHSSISTNFLLCSFLYSKHKSTISNNELTIFLIIFLLYNISLCLFSVFILKKLKFSLSKSSKKFFSSKFVYSLNKYSLLMFVNVPNSSVLFIVLSSILLIGVV